MFYLDAQSKMSESTHLTSEEIQSSQTIIHKTRLQQRRNCLIRQKWLTGENGNNYSHYLLHTLKIFNQEKAIQQKK